MIMKRYLLVLLLPLFTLCANADDPVKIDDIYYELTSTIDGNFAKVISSSEDYSGNVVIPVSVTFADVEYRVTSISDGAFANCTGLTSITIPKNVTSIGAFAFGNCKNLTSVIVNGECFISEDAFIGCTGLTSVTLHCSTIGSCFRNNSSIKEIILGNEVVSISGPFKCTGLTSITIPRNVTSIDRGAFAGCSNLSSVTLHCLKTGNSFSYMPSIKEIILGDEVVSIDHEAFKNCTGLTSITIPNDVSFIGQEAFSGCSSLTSITIPNVDTIFDLTFSECTSLSSVTIPNSVTYIGDKAFGWCTSLSSVTIPNSVTYIGVSAFGYCTSLSSVTIPNSVTFLCSSFIGCSSLISVTVEKKTPDIAIDDYTFTNRTEATLYVPAGSKAAYEAARYWKEFKTIVEASEPDPKPEPGHQVETFVEDVDDSAKEVTILFIVNEGSSSLTPTVTIANDTGVSGQFEIPATVKHNGVEYKVTEIAEGAFVTNTVLTDITIPASITSIGDNAFAGCSNLKSITIYNPTPINLSAVNARGFTRGDGSSVFVGVDKATCILYVPEGSVDAYKAAPVWSEFKNILPIKTSTGINGIDYNGEAYDVFNLSGRKVKAKAISLDDLPNGIYIINGKKVMKK